MLKYSSLSTVGFVSEQFSIMFSFFCQQPESETCFHQRQRAFRQCSRFECYLGQICPWMGSSSLLCLTCITHCIHKTDLVSLRQLFFVQKNLCENLWKDFDSRQIKAVDLKKKLSTLKVNSSPDSCFLLPTSTQSQSDGAHPAWPGYGHAWAPIPATWALSGTCKSQESFHWLQWWSVPRPQCSKGIKPLGINPS